jgi:outer membrane receptor for ferrienterochelin and colicin
MTARYALTRTAADFTERRTSSSIRMDLRDDSDAVSVHGGWSLTDALTVGMGVRQEWRAAPRDSAVHDGATVGNVTRGACRRCRRLRRRVEQSSVLITKWSNPVGAVLTRANANLLPERAVSADGAVAVSGRNWHASAGGFWTVVEDAIANVTIQSTPTIIRERRNAGEAHARGLEMDFDIRPISAVSLRASALAWTRSESSSRR